MTPTQAIKEIDTVIEQIISKTEKDKAEKLRRAYEVVKKDYQDKINLSVIRTDHSLYLQENDMDIKIKYQKSLQLYVARISDGSRYGRQVYYY